MSKREQEFLQTLLDRHLKGLTTPEEDRRLLNYFESFQGHPKWNAMLEEKEVVRDRMLENIKKSIATDLQGDEPEEKSGKVISVFGREALKRWAPYAAAASIVLAVSVSLWEQGGLTTPATGNAPGSEATITTVVTASPQKVTLTLENGAEVELGEGEEYQSAFAKSRGESIVYDSEEELQTEEIAYNEITVPRGKNFSLTLSDDTRLWINAGSKVKYPVRFQPNQDRTVELVYGEVYLDVTPSEKHHGDAFVLKTSEQELRVLGTEFNVRAYKEDPGIATTLVEGRIAITVNNEQHILNPSDQLLFNRDKGVTRMHRVDPYNYTSWKDGILNFESMTLENLMESIERWYDVEVVFENPELRPVHFSGVIRKSQDIQTIVNILQASDEKIRFKMQNDTIYVR